MFARRPTSGDRHPPPPWGSGSGSVRGPLLAIATAVACSACATGPYPGLTRSLRTSAGGAGLDVLHAPGTEGEALRVGRAVERAIPEVVRRWGALRHPLTVELLPDHAALEDAIDREGYPWLRAWARFDVVYLQAPSSWGLLAGSDGALHELLVHELTHVAMYQRASTPADWQRRRFPLWFREGMASVTARQGYRRADLAELARYLRLRPDRDPVGDADALYRTDSAAVYAAAHHAFAFLQARYGDARIRAILDRMRERDESFADAFERAVGLSLAAFEAEFRRYVLWEGWRTVGQAGGHDAGDGRRRQAQIPPGGDLGDPS